ncbi:MAG: hemolysin family protein [Actinomycetota bacterium]|nr:hemolysin family protein [Actinomycetota bacterium]
MDIIAGGIGIFILIVLAGYLAASETALMRVSRIRVRYLVEKQEKRAGKLESLVENPDSYLPTLLLVALLVQLGSASLATWLATRLTGNAGIGVLVGTATITALMFVFGELVPKAAASHESEEIALKVAPKIATISKVLRPIAKVFEWIAIKLLKAFGKEFVNVERIVSDEGEIKAIVTAAEESDLIEEEEKEMIHSVFEFSDTIAREVMVPRPDMVMLSAEATVSDAATLVVEHGYSRIPVYGESKDRIVGVLYAKDLLHCLNSGNLNGDIKGILRKPIFVPETKRLSDLLKELQKRKVHIAILVDEYGTITGLVTIEDILEEIVGEIFDEFDHEENLLERTGPSKYRVDARMNIEDLNEALSTSLPKEEDVDTMGGLVMKILGHVPVQGEKLEYDGIEFKVEKVRENRIQKIQIDLRRADEGDVSGTNGD